MAISDWLDILGTGEEATHMQKGIFLMMSRFVRTIRLLRIAKAPDMFKGLTCKRIVLTGIILCVCALVRLGKLDDQFLEH